MSLTYREKLASSISSIVRMLIGAFSALFALGGIVLVFELPGVETEWLERDEGVLYQILPDLSVKPFCSPIRDVDSGSALVLAEGLTVGVEEVLLEEAEPMVSNRC